VSSFNPSARAQALGGPVQFDISKLERGALAKIEWRGRPIYIVHRTDEMLASLKKDEAMLRDPSSKESAQPSYATNEHRSLRPEFLVLEGVCTHLGCAPLRRISVRTGRAASSAPAMAPGSTSLAACFRAYLRR
jgi:ubiquinol-cytochrome c reductase iron-sulfur subunit